MPHDSPTPYPHSLTSISLLVSPQQIRKASQHLHGDGPHSSRWPQCAARQLKRERRAGKRKWVRIRGEQGRQREAASASGPSTDVCTCTLGEAHKHAHTYAGAFMPRCTPSRGLPNKNKYPPHAGNKASAEWEWKEGRERRGKCSAQQTAPRISHTQSSPTVWSQGTFQQN